MQDRTRFLLYGIILVLDLSILANLGTQGMLQTGNLGVAVSSCLLLTVGIFLAMFNYEPFRTTRQQERVLLRRVKDSWIESLLEITRLTPHSVLFHIGWQVRDDLSGGCPEESSNEALEQLVSQGNILEVFEGANNSLLVLGGAGVGKTVILLELTRKLLRAAQKDPSKAIPIIVNLSTWRNDAGPFSAWVRTQLGISYDVSQETAFKWLRRKRLLFLLDGLDEVNQEYRKSCVDAINDFLNEKPAGIVVCSRRREYMEIGPRLNLSKTLCVGGITTGDLKKYLPSDLGETMRKLLALPLRLSIVSRIGAEVVKSATALSEEEVNRRLFEEYIRRQLETESDSRYEPARVKSWLKWLAERMREYSQSIFLIEQLQPRWLDTTDKVIYVVLSRVSSAVAVMSFGVATMFFSKNISLLAGAPPGVSWIYSLIGVQQGLLIKWLVITCFAGGLTMAGVDLTRLTRAGDSNPSDAGSGFENSRWTPFSKAASSIAVNWLVCAGVFFAAARILRIETTRAGAGALIYGLAFGAVLWFRGRGQTWRSDIRTADRLVFSLARVPAGLGWGILVGVLIGLFVWLVVGPVAARNLRHLGLLTALFGPLIGGTLSALKKISIVEKSSPNQGIRMTARNAVLVWLLVSVVSVSAIWIYAVFATGSAKDTLESALFFGMVLGLLFGFSYAGLDIVYHWTLRFILWISSYAPWRYVDFLDYAADLGFLRKVGGSYIFLHDLLRNHLADLPTSAAKVSGDPNNTPMDHGQPTSDAQILATP